jgi:signal transduction histidine kinase
LVADVAAAAFAIAGAAGAATTMAGGPADPQTYTWRVAADTALIVLAAAVTVPVMRAAHARRMVSRAAAAIADDPRHTKIGAASVLAAAFGDPALRVAYPVSDGTWRDDAGDPVTLPESGVIKVTDGGEVIAALVHGGVTRMDQASVSGAVSAARLLLDAERLEAGVLARVNDLRAARRQVVEAADGARSKLERDLHDGAQQRLVALRYALGLAASRAERQGGSSLAAALAEADLAAERALADLRHLAHGMSAPTLSVEGLASAIRSAAEQATSVITIRVLPDEKFPVHVEQTVYRFVADCLREIRQAPVQDVSIGVRRLGGEVIADLEHDAATNGPDWTATDIADRIATAGGYLEQAEIGGRHQLRAHVPCE